MTPPDLPPSTHEALKPYPIDIDALKFTQLIEDAKLWVHAADQFLNDDIDTVLAAEENPADLVEYHEHTREGANVLNFLRRKIDSEDIFIIRLLAELQRSALNSKDPEAVRTQQFDDLEHLLNEFRKSV